MDSNLEREIESRVKIDDFPENFKRIAETIGVEMALQLVKNSGGINQYIPVYDCVTSAARDRLIMEEFQHDNYQELAVKYRISEVWIRNIVDRDRRRKNREAMERNQTTLNLDDTA